MAEIAAFRKTHAKRKMTIDVLIDLTDSSWLNAVMSSNSGDSLNIDSAISLQLQVRVMSM
jgi:hypothetical protein